MEKGKGKEQKGPKGKEDSKGKGKSKDGQKGAYAKQSDGAESSYTNQTAYEKDWGLAKDNQKWEREYYNEDWIQIRGRWCKNYNRKGRRCYDDGYAGSVSPPTTWIGKEETSDQVRWRDETSMMKFGDYPDWAYGEILTSKPNYLTYIPRESFGGSEEHQRFQEWATLMTFGSEKETTEEWKEKNP